MLYATEQLIIRKWNEADTKDLFEYCSNPEVTKYLTFPTYKTKTEAQMRILTIHKYYELYCMGQKDAQIDFAIELKSTGKVIGSIGFVNYNDKTKTIELGYILNPKYQGKGHKV